MTDLIQENPVTLVRQAIDLAASCYTKKLPESARHEIHRWIEVLEKTPMAIEPGNMNVVIFHTTIPDAAGKVISPDIKNLDHGKIDYQTLIRLNIEIALKTNPRSRVILITDDHFLSDMIPNERLHIQRFDVVSTEPVYERVKAMVAYVHSKWFNAPTIFLDSDAFLLRPIYDLFANRFDIGLTHRDIPGQMPINEGVIYVNDLSKSRVQAFFDSYLASYCNIDQNLDIKSIYPNVRRWRGGQLALNAVGQGGQACYTGKVKRADGTMIAFLPCSIYNLSDIDEREINRNLIYRCTVLHLKGMRKKWMSRLRGLIENTF